MLRYAGVGEAPTGWINTTNFNIIKDDGQPAGQNLSADMMISQSVFFFAEGSAGSMRVVANDDGVYRATPFRANTSAVSIPFFNPSNFSYFTSSNSNYKVTVLGGTSVYMHPLSFRAGYYIYPVFTANGSRPGATFSSLFEFSPVAAQSDVILSGKGITLTTNGTTTNLTGQAKLTVSGFSRAGLSVFEFSQTYIMLDGTRLVFDSGSFDFHNLNGTIGSPQAGEIPLHNATVKIASTTSAVIQMAYPLNYATQTTTMNIQVRGAVLDLAERGQPEYPGAEMVEATGITYVRALTIGLGTFLGGFFLDRARIRSR